MSYSGSSQAECFKRSLLGHGLALKEARHFWQPSFFYLMYFLEVCVEDLVESVVLPHNEKPRVLGLFAGFHG